tara:strand:- start:1627 stop:2046 length:420 start_codon:yes stop_codon:yes gene_type:complete
MIATWPTDLPRPERNTWSAQLQDGRRKKQGDTGPAGFGGRFSSVASSVSLSVLLTRDQKAVFDNFYRDDCNLGTRLFRMPDPTTDGWGLLTSEGVPLLTDDGAPILLAKIWLCTWGETTPTETVQGTEFRKSFSIQVMP